MSVIGKSYAELLGDIAQRARRARLSRGWSQAELAKRAGVPLPTYKLFERTGRISISALIRVSGAMGRLPEFDALFQSRPQSLDEMIGPELTRRRGRTLE